MEHVESRSDSTVQGAIKSMFLGIAPERTDELERLWRDNDLRFHVLPDDGPEGSFIMDAGKFRDVRFNHRVMRAFWVACFAAWEAYRLCAEDDSDFSNLGAMLSAVSEILAAENSESIELPNGIPSPGTLEGLPWEQKAPADLAVFAVGWAFLHEVRHIRHQREGTSAPRDDVELRRQEELSCDEFATNFLLSSAEKYAQIEGVNISKVMQKRQAGIHFAIFALTVLSRENWTASDSHPAMQTRIHRSWETMQEHSLNVVAAGLAIGGLISLSQMWDGVPLPPEKFLISMVQSSE